VTHHTIAAIQHRTVSWTDEDRQNLTRLGEVLSHSDRSLEGRARLMTLHEGFRELCPDGPKGPRFKDLCLELGMGPTEGRALWKGNFSRWLND
jgi:hypothetical protein